MVKKKKKIHLQCRRPRFDPWVGKIPWRREWLPTLVFLPGESRGQSSLAGHSPWGLYFPKKKEDGKGNGNLAGLGSFLSVI